MAPLFGQQLKAQELEGNCISTARSLDHHNQQHLSNITPNSSGGGRGTSRSADNKQTNVSGVDHSMNPHHSSTSANGAPNYHHQSGSTIPPPLPPLRQTSQNCKSTTKDATAIRKYLVLLQDCLAIKFAPLVTGQPSHPYPFAFNTTNNNPNKNSSCHSSGGGCHTVVDDDEDDLASHRQSNHPPHHRVVLNGSSINNNSKCSRNSINEPLTTNISTNNCCDQGTNLSSNNNNRNCSHQHNHFTLGSNHASNHNNGDPQQACHHKPSHCNHYHPTLRQHPFHFLQSSNAGGTLGRSSTTYPNAMRRNDLGSNTAEVDHSLHALYLYKGFKEANLHCYWNAALSETFRNIQYKGYVVPSTILVGALPKFLSILRTAWSRQMLRCPAGYRIEFIGEIEELIADPIQKGQFAPLSDSLCWAILELTSLGQEAFVDSIMTALQMAFPTMSCPSRELVFQTLEKLIKERKVYQTSRGYFVVTPDIFRYMISANLHEFDGNQTLSSSSPVIALDALFNPNLCEDKSSFSHQPWESAAGHNRCSSTSTGEEILEVAPSPKLKRHNSLKLIRQRDAAVTQMSGSTGHRRHSLRLPKSKSCGRMNDTIEDDEEVKRTKVKSSTIEHISRAMRSLTGTMTFTMNSNDGGTTAHSEKSKKNKSLLSKLFPFRRSNSKTRNEKIATPPPTTVTAACRASTCSNTSTASTNTSSSDGSESPPPIKIKHSENAKDSAKFISTQTQTSNSTEQLCVPSITLSSSSSPQSPSHPASFSIPLAENHGRVMTVDSAAERSSLDIILNPDFINGDGSHQTRSSSRRSMSILDESPLYDVLQDVPTTQAIATSSSAGCAMSEISPNFQVGCPVAPPTFPGYNHNHRGESSRCSTLSSQAASSLGYGSQGHPSLSSNCSPNLDTGLTSYGYYGGDGSVACSSHSPCGFNCNSLHNGNGSTNFPQPAKPSVYSSARYKNSYEWYKKRYPNYISPAAGRTSPLYASLTAPRSKSRSRPTYDSLLAPMDENHGLVQMSENRRRASLYSPHDLGTNSMRNKCSDQNGMRQNTEEDGTAVNTTTVTQAVKSTTNMELELLLPLGKIMKAALRAKKDAIKDAWLRDELGPGYASYANKKVLQQQNSNGAVTSSNTNKNSINSNNEEPIKVNLDNTGAKLRVGEPSTKTEVTTVVNNNGVIETHFDISSGINQPLADLSSPSMQSTVAFRTNGGVTDVVLVNGNTGQETKISTGEASACKQEVNISNTNKNLQRNHVDCTLKSQPNSSLDKNQKCSGSTRDNILNKNTTTCVKISDIGRDSAADDVIKVC